VEVVTKLQLMLENMDGTVEWPITVFTEAAWIKLSKDQKMQILEKIEQGSFFKASSEGENEEGPRKLNSCKLYSRIH